MFLLLESGNPVLCVDGDEGLAEQVHLPALDSVVYFRLLSLSRAIVIDADNCIVNTCPGLIFLLGGTSSSSCLN